MMKEKQNRTFIFNPVVLPATTFILMCLFISCEDNIDVVLSTGYLPETVLSEEMVSIKNEFTRLYDGKAFTRSSGVSRYGLLFEALQPQWENAFNEERGNEKIVLVPLTAGLKNVSVSHESAERYRETGDSRYLNVSTLLCFKTDHKTDDSVFFFMSIIPSADYLEEVDFDLSRNNYFQRDSLFDGQVFYHDLSLSFVNGWEYVGGVVTNYLYMDDPQAPQTRSSGGMTCYEVWTVIVDDYYYQGNGGPPVYNFTRYTFTSDYFCVNNADGDHPAIWWIAPDEVPGGGGGYNPLSLKLRENPQSAYKIPIIRNG